MIHVTEILDYPQEPELVDWKLRTPNWKQISREALRIGTLVDTTIMAELKGYSPSTPQAIQEEAVVNCLQAWQRFKEDHPLFVGQIVGIQRELTDGEIIGHPDLEIRDAQRYGIIDIKTSKAIQPKHWTQVAAYLALSSTNRPKLAPDLLQLRVVKQMVAILRLDKSTAHYEYQEITDGHVILNEIKVFRAYRTIYQYRQQIQETMRRMAEEEAFDVA